VAEVELRVVDFAVLCEVVDDHVNTSEVRVVDNGELRFDAAFQKFR
jgi:hypothetical protein